MWAGGALFDSSQLGPRGFDGSGLKKKVLVSAVKRLVAFRLRIPAHTNGQDMRIGDALKRREVKRQSFVVALLVLQAPAAYGGPRSKPQKTLLVFQMLIAAQNLRPLPVRVLRDHCAGNDGARQVVRRRFRHDVSCEELLLAVFCQIPE